VPNPRPFALLDRANRRILSRLEGRTKGGLGEGSPKHNDFKKVFSSCVYTKKQNRLQGVRGERLPWWVVTGIMELMPACSTGMLIMILLMRT
jgi:hypothetical protein